MDPDQLGFSEASWSGSTLFSKKDISSFMVKIRYAGCPSFHGINVSTLLSINLVMIY